MFSSGPNFFAGERYPCQCQKMAATLVIPSEQDVPAGVTATVQFVDLFGKAAVNINVNTSGEGIFIAEQDGFYGFIPIIALTQYSSAGDNSITLTGKVTPVTAYGAVTISGLFSQPQFTINADGSYELPGAVLATWLRKGDQFEVLITTTTAPVAISSVASRLIITQLC